MCSFNAYFHSVLGTGPPFCVGGLQSFTGKIAAKAACCIGPQPEAQM